MAEAYANPNANPEELAGGGSSLLGQLAELGLTGIAAKTGIGVPFDPEIAAAMPDSAARVPDLVDMTGELIPGPADGGSFFERPIAGSLADASLTQSLGLEYQPGALIEAAAGKGQLIVDGINIDIDQIRGGIERGTDMAGSFIEQPAEMVENGVEMARELSREGLDYIEQHKDEWIAALGDGASDLAHAIQEQAPQLLDTLDQGVDDLSSLISQHVDPRMALHFAGHIAQLLEDRRGDRINELDYQQAIGRAALEIEHHAKLQEALRVGDTGRVETEVQVNGAITSIMTEFEARHPDEELEKKVGEEHLRDAIRAPLSDVHDYLHAMQLHSHFEEQSFGRSRRR